MNLRLSTLALVLALIILGWAGVWSLGRDASFEDSDVRAVESLPESTSQSAEAVAVDRPARTPDSQNEPSAGFRVRLIDPDGEPISAGRVKAFPAQQYAPAGVKLHSLAKFPPAKCHSLMTTHTDEQGICEFVAFDLNTQAIALDCEAPGFLTHRSWVPSNGASSLDKTVVLERALAIRIRVVDQKTSQAIEGAQLRGFWREGLERYTRVAQTDHAGESMLWVRPQQAIRFNVHHAGYTMGYLSLEPDEVQAPDTIHEIALERGRSLEVIVHEADGTPLPGAQVYLAEIDRQSEDVHSLADPRSAGLELSRGTTNADGRLVVSGIMQQRGLQVLAAVGDRVVQKYPVRAGDIVQMTMPDALACRWQFINAQGQPIPELEVALVSTEQVGWPPISQGTTNSLGQCDFMVSPGSYAVFAVNQNWAFASPQAEHFDAENQTRRKCIVQQAAGLKLRASTAPDATQPYASLARVYAQPDASPDVEQPHWAEFAVNLNADRMGYLRDSEQFVGLIPGQCRVWVQALGCLAQVFPVELQAGETTQVETELSAESHAHIQVVDPLGNAVDEAWLWIYSKEDLASTGLERPMAGGATDADGFVAMSRLKVGEAEIQFSRSFSGPRESMPFVIEEGINSCVVRFSSLLGAVSVSIDQVLQHAQPRAWVSLRKIDSRGNARSGMSERGASIDDSNQAWLADVKPGDYELVLAGIRAIALSQRVTVEQGQTAHVDFSAEGLLASTIEVTGPAGEALEGAVVLLVPAEEQRHPRNLKLTLMRPAMQSPRHAKATTGPDGLARVLGELPEACQVLAYAPGFQIATQMCRPSYDPQVPFASVQLQASAELTIYLSHIDAAGQTTAVRGKRGEFRVWAVTAAGAEHRFEEDDLASSFHNAVLQPGALEVRIERRTESGAWVRVATRSGTIAATRASEWTMPLDIDSN